jgi:hypothetical protein
MWTSGRLVNVWNQPRKSRDVKYIHVHVHTRNIPWIRGCFRNVKVPSSPYKRGREGTCKGIHNFWGVSSLLEILSLLFRELCSRLKCSRVLYSCTSVFGDPIRIFGHPQQLYSDVSTEHLISLLHIINYRVPVVVRCKCMVMHASDGSCSRRTSGR